MFEPLSRKHTSRPVYKTESPTLHDGAATNQTVVGQRVVDARARHRCTMRGALPPCDMGLSRGGWGIPQAAPRVAPTTDQPPLCEQSEPGHIGSESEPELHVQSFSIAVTSFRRHGA